MTGRIVSHYRVLERLGQGGMGVVYKAEDLRLGRSVALKFLNAISNRALGRFEREARAASGLNHPNICIVYEFDHFEGQPFLAMELLDGKNLNQLIDEGNTGDILNVCIQIAEALEVAHAKGTVHRDIKPANIVVTTAGQVKVLDFGLAQIERSDEESEDSLTATGVAVGTVAYMSPEQAAGEEIDARSDIFSFGLVMNELAGITCPPDLLLVIRKATERDRRFRYQSASDLCADLKRLRRDSRSGVTAASGSGSTVTARRKRSRTLDSLVVLPFVNQSGDPEMEYLSEGITDTLINSLSQLRKLRVTPRSIAFRHKGPQVDPNQVGVELGVDAVLTGRVSLRGDTLIVGTELLDVGQSSQIGGALYNRKLADIFVIQEEIANQIVDKFRMQLSGDEKKQVTRRAAQNKEAYQLYLKALYFLNRWSARDLHKAIEFSEQAIAADPGCAPAYAILSHSYYVLGHLGFLRPSETNPKAKAAALKAVELDASSSLAHVALGQVLLFCDWKFEEARRECVRALELNAGDPLAHLILGAYFVTQSKFQESIQAIQKAVDLDPFSPSVAIGMGYHSMLARDYPRAMLFFKKTLELDRYSIPAAMELSYVHAWQGRFDDALQLNDKATAAMGDKPFLRAVRGAILSAAGKLDEARAIANELEQRSGIDPHALALTAGLQAMLGNKKKSLDILEALSLERFALLVYFRNHPLFDSLHGDPRFEDLMRRIGLAPVP